MPLVFSTACNCFHRFGDGTTFVIIERALGLPLIESLRVRMSACMRIRNINRYATIERPSITQAACAEEASLVLPTVAAVKFYVQDACSVDILPPLLSYSAAVRASERAG